jgi:uncharacterized protein (DUF58 family)
MAADHDEELSALLAEVRRIEVQTRRLAAGVMTGGYASVFRGAGIEFEEVREYEAGDDPRSIDWNVSARVGRPFVKKYRDERQVTLLFLLDLSASMSAGFGAWSGRQAAARVCACLAVSAAAAGDKVGLAAFGEEVDRWVEPRKGWPHALRIVRDCLALPASPGPTRLGPALDFATRTLRRRAVVFVVSDFLCGGWQREIARCAGRHDVIAVRLLSPELDEPATGLVRLRDPEGGGTTVVDFGRRRVREGWGRTVAAWRARTEEDLRIAGVDRLDLPIPRSPRRDSVTGPVLRFFRMRERRGAKR